MLTGSTRHDSLPRAAQALTGRLSRLPVLPLSKGEIGQVHEDLLTRLLTDPDSATGPGPTRQRRGSTTSTG